MAGADRERWNARYSAGEYDAQPDEWLVSHTELLQPARAGARALDLACGAGRHALFLAHLGYSVEAWDISDVGLNLLEQKLAATEGLEVRPRRVDLDSATLPSSEYDLVVDLYFLDRRLLAELPRALRPGGLLIVKTLMRRREGEDRNPAHLLAPGELRPTVGELDCIEYAEDDDSGWAALVARRPAAARSTD